MSEVSNFLSEYYSKSYRSIYHSILLIGILSGIIRWRKLIPANRIFLLLLIVTLIAELTGAFTGHYLRNSNFGYNIFTFAQYLLISFAFYKETKIKSFFLVSNIVLAVFGILNACLWQPFVLKMNTNTLLLENLFVLVLVMLFLSRYFLVVDNVPLTKISVFWICYGWLLFSIGSIISFGFIQLVKGSNSWDTINVNIRHYSNYLLYASFIPAFLCSQKSLNDFTTGSK